MRTELCPARPRGDTQPCSPFLSHPSSGLFARTRWARGRWGRAAQSKPGCTVTCPLLRGTACHAGAGQPAARELHAPGPWDSPDSKAVLALCLLRTQILGSRAEQGQGSGWELSWADNFSQKPRSEPEPSPPTSPQTGLSGAGYALGILPSAETCRAATLQDTAQGLGPAQHAPDDVRVLPVFPFALLPLAVHHGGIHVGRRKRVGFIQQRDHAQENGPGKQQTGAGKSRGGQHCPRPAMPAASVSQHRGVPRVRRGPGAGPPRGHSSARRRRRQRRGCRAHSSWCSSAEPTARGPAAAFQQPRHLPQAPGPPRPRPRSPSPHVLRGVPPLRRQLPALRVVHRRVEDGDADVAGLKAQVKRDPRELLSQARSGSSSVLCSGSLPALYCGLGQGRQPQPILLVPRKGRQQWWSWLRCHSLRPRTRTLWLLAQHGQGCLATRCAAGAAIPKARSPGATHVAAPHPPRHWHGVPHQPSSLESPADLDPAPALESGCRQLVSGVSSARHRASGAVLQRQTKAGIFTP